MAAAAAAAAAQLEAQLQLQALALQDNILPMVDGRVLKRWSEPHPKANEPVHDLSAVADPGTVPVP